MPRYQPQRKGRACGAFLAQAYTKKEMNRLRLALPKECFRATQTIANCIAPLSASPDRLSTITIESSRYRIKVGRLLWRAAARMRAAVRQRERCDGISTGRCKNLGKGAATVPSFTCERATAGVRRCAA